MAATPATDGHLTMTSRDVVRWLSSVDDLLDHSDTERPLSQDAMRWAPESPIRNACERVYRSGGQQVSRSAAQRAYEDAARHLGHDVTQVSTAGLTRWQARPLRIEQWPAVQALSPDDLITLQASIRRFAATVAEAMRAVASAYQRPGVVIGETVATMHRAGLLAEEPAEDPMARALRLRQDRDTGPGWRYGPGGQRVAVKR